MKKPEDDVTKGNPTAPTPDEGAGTTPPEQASAPAEIPTDPALDSKSEPPPPAPAEPVVDPPKSAVKPAAKKEAPKKPAPKKAAAAEPADEPAAIDPDDVDPVYGDTSPGGEFTYDSPTGEKTIKVHQYSDDGELVLVSYPELPFDDPFHVKPEWITAAELESFDLKKKE